MKLANYVLDALFAAGKYEEMVQYVADQYGLPAPPFFTESICGRRWCRVYIYEGNNCHFYDRDAGFITVQDNFGGMTFSCISTM